MNQLRLLAIEQQLFAAFQRSLPEFEAVIGANSSAVTELIGSVLEQTMALLTSKPRDAMWGCFLAVDDTTSQVVGTCGYKADLSASGSVEIAYFTFPPFEQRGYATAMAGELAQRAADHIVIAHTLPQQNASCRVLEKAGFQFDDEVIDLEDGTVWRWIKTPVYDETK
jgi:ribosomal-protein-alanine N-acetyltransferase